MTYLIHCNISLDIASIIGNVKLRQQLSTFSFSVFYQCNNLLGFDLTFQKWLKSFANKNAKLVLNVTHHGSAIKKIFHSRSPETTFFTFLSSWKTSDLDLILEDFYKKIIVLKYSVNNHLKKNDMEFRIHPEEDHLSFYENSTNQTFNFIGSKVVYFIKDLANQV